MMDIAAIGRQQLKDALSAEMKHCKVTEWLDDAGECIKIYWKPLTGVQQAKINMGQTDVDRTCLCVKVRALDESGKQIFKDTPLESLVADYEYPVLRAIAFLMSTDVGQDMDDEKEKALKE